MSNRFGDWEYSPNLPQNDEEVPVKGRADRQTDGEPIYKLKGAAVKAGVGGGGGRKECGKRADRTKNRNQGPRAKIRPSAA